MPRTSLFIEPLEDRRLLSVTATTLAGPLTTGTSWTYQIALGGQSIVMNNVVAGPATVNGNKCVEIDSRSAAGPSNSLGRQYSAVNSKGAFSYKTTSEHSGLNYNGSGVTQFTPALCLYPGALVAGKTYTFNCSEKISTTIRGKTMTQTASIKHTVKLVSERMTKVTVPAGTFSVYTIQTTTTTTMNGGATTASTTNYVAPGVGEVKEIAGSSTMVLTKFSKK